MIDEKEKETSYPAQPPSSPPPTYVTPLPSPPGAQPYLSQPSAVHYGTGPPGQFNPMGQPGQFGQLTAPGQQQPGQFATHPGYYTPTGQPGPYGQPGQPGQQGSYFSPPVHPGTFSPQGQPVPLNPQHTGSPHAQHTGHSGHVAPQTTASPGQYPNPAAAYPPQSPPTMSQHQQLSVNYTPGVSPGMPNTPATGHPAAPVQQPFITGSQYQQEMWARCARGDHDVVTKHGPTGIIAAVLLFPIGLLCLFMDVEKKCGRCGAIIPV